VAVRTFAALRDWRTAFLAYFDTGRATNGGPEVMLRSVRPTLAHTKGWDWARNAKGPSEETVFPLVGVHLGVVGLTGLELVNRLRRQRWTVGDYPGQSGIH
jgi:hypothetical protein